VKSPELEAILEGAIWLIQWFASFLGTLDTARKRAWHFLALQAARIRIKAESRLPC